MNMNGFYSFQLLFFYLVIFFWTCFYDICVSDCAVYEFTVDYFLSLDPFTALSIQSMICELPAIDHSSIHCQLTWIISPLLSILLYNHPDSIQTIIRYITISSILTLHFFNIFNLFELTICDYLLFLFRTIPRNSVAPLEFSMMISLFW